MDNKEGSPYSYSVQKSIDKILTCSAKFNLKTCNLSNIVGQLDMEKEYLAKLRSQRQKTQKLHSQFVKLKKQKDKMRQDQESEVSSLKVKLTDCQAQINKKTQQTKQLEKQTQKLRAQLEKLNRQKNESITSLRLNYQHSLMELKHNIDNLNESLQSKNKQINNLKKAFNTKASQLENQRNQFQNKWKSTQQRLKQSQQRRKESQKITSDLNKKVEELNLECYKSKTQLEGKVKQINLLRTSIQRIQLDYQASCRKLIDLESKANQLQESLAQKQKQNETNQQKCSQYQQQIRGQKQQNQRLKIEAQQFKNEIQNLKLQLTKKQQLIREFQMKIMRKQDEQFWKQKVAEKENESKQILDLLQKLREQNDQLIKFIKQKQAVQRQRKSLVEHQLEQIFKFESLLKDVK